MTDQTIDTTSSLKAEFETFLVESAKFDRGNAAAGTRARKALSEIAKLVKQRRNEITAVKHERAEAKAAKKAE